MNALVSQFLTSEATRNYARLVDPQGNPVAGEQLDRLSPPELFDQPISDSEMAACCHSGLWLLNNFLDRSHEISQSIASAEGSWWHAIMHRIEGDFSNAKYWYRHVGDHVAMQDIKQEKGQGGFDFAAFVDQCQIEYASGPLSDETQAIAFSEWQALFDYCHQHAI